MHLPRPDWRPDAPATWWATRCSGDLMGDQMAPGRPDCCWSCCLLGKYQGLLNKCEQKQASFGNQIAPGDQIGRPDFHILVTLKIWSPIWSPGAIWSPIWSLERLVVVDAVTLSLLIISWILNYVIAFGQGIGWIVICEHNSNHLHIHKREGP